MKKDDHLHFVYYFIKKMNSYQKPYDSVYNKRSVKILELLLLNEVITDEK